MANGAYRWPVMLRTMTRRLLLATLPARLPAYEKLRLRDRLGIAVEIVSLYGPSLMSLRRGRLRETLAAVRAAAPPAAGADAPDQLRTAVRLGNIIQRSFDRIPTDNRCLIRSLVLVRMLARRSIDSTLVIGVSTHDGFRAHAWVEHGGRALLPVGDHAELTRL